MSLLTDAASEMVLPLLPVFLTTTLGGGAMALGWIEGLADAVASALKLVSGRWADRLGRNQPLMLLGYGISTIARPFVAIAQAPWHVLAVRVTDRVGKGIRSSRATRSSPRRSRPRSAARRSASTARWTTRGR